MGKSYALQAFENSESFDESNDNGTHEKQRLGIPKRATPWAEYKAKNWILKEKSVGEYFKKLIKNQGFVSFQQKHCYFFEIKKTIIFKQTQTK